MELASVQCWQLLTSHSGTQYWCRRSPGLAGGLAKLLVALLDSVARVKVPARPSRFSESSVGHVWHATQPLSLGLALALARGLNLSVSAPVQ
jgi:hypothetical protein